MRLEALVMAVFLLGSSVAVIAEEDPAGETEDPLGGLIAQGHRPMTLSEKGLSGPGAIWLLEEAQRARFFLVGESHGNVETPALTAALAEPMRGFGYTVMAIEVGPVIVEEMKRLAAEKDGMAAFQRFHDAWPLTIPFFFWREEVAMFLQLRALGYDAWGLDQEFIGSARYLLSELATRVEEPELHRRIESWRDRAARGYQAFTTDGDQTRAFLNAVDPDELAVFAAELPPDAAAARRIVDELRASAVVYQHFQNGRYYLNNRDRIRLMKRHLAEYVAAAGGLEAAPRVLFKLGSAHAGRGYSPFHQLDVGNAAAELAAARFSDSFHLQVLTTRSVGLDGAARDWTEQTPYLALFAAHRAPERWGVFDLRPLRQHFAAEKNRAAHPDLAELVFRFDALALAPAFHAARPMIDLPF